MSKRPLTHSLTQSDWLMAHEAELQEIIDRQYKSFSSSRKISNVAKAHDFVETQEAITRIQYSKKRTPYWYVTINPKPDVSIELLHNTIVHVLQDPLITDPYWVYEIRSAPDQGLHAHILFTCNADNNFCDRKLKAPFVPEICGTKKHVCVKWIEQSELDAVRSYMKKTTVARSKKVANDATIAWRTSNSIPTELCEDHLLVWSEMTDI